MVKIKGMQFLTLAEALEDKEKFYGDKAIVIEDGLKDNDPVVISFKTDQKDKVFIYSIAYVGLKG